jgi:hypothetical protein
VSAVERRFVDLHRFMRRTQPGDSCLAEPENKTAWVQKGLMTWDPGRRAWVMTPRGATLVADPGNAL